MYAQGREIAFFEGRDPNGKIPNETNVWGVIPYKGLIYFADHYNGLWAVKLVDDDFAIADSAIIAGFSYISGFKQGSEPAIRIINASFGKYDRSKSVELFINALKNFGKTV